MPLLRVVLKNFIQTLKAGSIGTAERDALTLLAFGLDLSTTDVLLNQDKFISDTDLFKLNALINKGEKSNIAAKKIAEQTGIDKKWLYSKLHKKLDKKKF